MARKLVGQLLAEGVAIYGRNHGVEFCANWWNWRPIHSFANQAIEAAGLQFDTSHWGTNDGAGLQTQEECNQLADAMEQLLGDTPHNSPVKLGSEDRDRAEDSAAYLGLKSMGDVDSVYSTSTGKVREFIQFLRTCGGFSID
jgi:hypothetical protein